MKIEIFALEIKDMQKNFPELQTISAEEMRFYFNKISSQFDELSKKVEPSQKVEYLTRDDVSKLLKCDPSTVHNWTKKGILKSYSVNGRVYYLSNEIEEALVPIKRIAKK